MAQIEEILFPIEEAINHVIKVEPLDLESNDDGSSKYADESAKNWIGEKMGEIFRVSDKKWRLVCVHCSCEFRVFAQFTAHVEEHLRSMLGTTIEIKPEVEEDAISRMSLRDQEDFRYSGSESDGGIEWNKGVTKGRTSEQNASPCPKCGKCYSTLSNMRRHVKVCCRNKVHFKRNRSIGESIEETEEEKSKNRPKDEVEDESTEENFSCPKCEKCYSNLSNMRRHEKICDTTQAHFNRAGSHNDFKYDGNEENSTFRLDMFPCPKCRKCYSTLSNMRRHEKVCHRKKTHLKRERTKSKDLDEIIEAKNKKRPKDEVEAGGTEETFPCPKCHKSYSTLSNMRRHEKECNAPKDHFYRCSDCGKEFSFQSELKSHVKSHTTDGLKHSIFEGESDKEECAPTKESSTVEDSSEITPCPECGKIYSNLSNMRRHMNKHLAKTINCPICNKIFSDNGYVREHMRITHKIDKFYWCNECGEAFKYKRNLDWHQKEHDGKILEKNRDVIFECYMCHETFEEQLKLRYHLRRHWSISIPCQVCGQFFKFKTTLARHMRLHDLNVENLIKCEQCPMSFSSHKQLRLHLRKDHDFPIYQTYRRLNQKEPDALHCDYCKKTFHRKTNLRLHMTTHIPEPYRVKYTCHICGLSFLQKSNMARHINNHENRGQFTCEYCHKSFRKEYMEDHIRTHTNERPFQCSVCGKTFTMSRGLDRHMICHSNERKYKCTLCPKTYLRAYQLTVHRRTHTGEFIYNCTDCRKGFTEKRSLKKHMLSYHGRPLDGSNQDQIIKAQGPSATTSN